MAYKASCAVRHFVKLDQWEATSKTCADCGHKLAELPLDIRAWECPGCGEHHDRDVNAALNILPSRHRSTTGERFARPCPWRPA
jgi:putative transposase